MPVVVWDLPSDELLPYRIHCHPTGMTGETGSGPSSGSVLVTGTVNSAANTGAAWLRQIWTHTLLGSALLPQYPFATRGFRPSF